MYFIQFPPVVKSHQVMVQYHNQDTDTVKKQNRDFPGGPAV